jgi:surface carbohydrate biosynthesis protein (TIGR04326 family)
MLPSRFFLLADAGRPAPEEEGLRVIRWNGPKAAPGELSAPLLLEERLPRIRAELAAWVYDLGRLDVSGREMQERLKAGDSLSMWWCSLLFEKHPRMLPGLYEVFKLRALELFLEEEACAELTLAGGDAKLGGILEDFCRARNLRFRRLPARTRKKAEAGLSIPARVYSFFVFAARIFRKIRAERFNCFKVEPLYYALPAPLKATARFFRWLVAVKRLLPRTALPRPCPAGATIATYFPNIDPKAAEEGRFRSRYWESLHDALVPAPGERHKVHWLFIAFPFPGWSLRRCVELVREFRRRASDGAGFHYLEEFLAAGDIAACVARWLRLVAASLRVQATARRHFYLRGSHMDLWPHLGGAFADSFRGWRALERCLQRRACIRYAQWRGFQEWTVFPMENCPWERMLTQALHEEKAGMVYGAQHSTVRPTDFRYFDDQRVFEAGDCRLFQPDRIFTNGRGALDEMLAAGYGGRRPGVLEALRYLYLAGERPPSSEGKGERRLLLLTSFFVDETQDLLATLAEILKRPERMMALAGLRVLVKPHPSLDVEPYLRDLFPDGGAPEIATFPLGELLVPGTVVWAANSTTAALEAAMRGLPLMVQAPGNDFDLCPLQSLPSLARIRDGDDVLRALAHPSCPELPEEYLSLDPALPRWRALLRIEPAKGGV